MFRKKRENLYIVGSGGLAKEVYNFFVSGRGYNFAGYIDEDYNKCDNSKNIFHIDRQILSHNDEIIIAIGDPHAKARLKNHWSLLSASNPLLYHEKTCLAQASIGYGSILFPHVVCTANNKIGKNVTIYQHCSISHDTTIGDYCNITPGVHIAGRCRIGNFVYLGIGCTISNDVSICDDVVVGAGAVVVEDITEPGTYVGVPARKIIK